MSIQKFYKLWLEINPYRNIYEHELKSWHLEVGQYEGVNDFRDLQDRGLVDPGVRWGKTVDTGIFSKEVVIPAEFQGYAIYLEIITGGEALVSINGSPYQGNDPNHFRVLLSDKIKKLSQVQVKVESFVRRSHNEIGESKIDPATSGEFTRAALCAVHTQAQEFLWDIQFALELWHVHEEYGYGIERILTRLFAAFDVTRRESFLAYIDTGRNLLREGLDHMGVKQEEFTLWMIGQSHLDLAWFWRKNETYRKVVRTFTSVLRNMEQFDQYRFMMPQVFLFKILKEASPEVYRQVKEKILAKKIEPAGLFYVEPDTNLVNGEWLLRHILWGRKFYQEEFGVVPTTESLIDAFGYSGNIPQILLKSGLNAVMVTKMRWYNDTNAFPYSVFLWQGIDGSQIMAATMPGFNYQCNSQAVKDAVDKNLQKPLLKDIPVFFGWGDGGGGADENHLQGLQRLIEWYKPARVRTSTLQEYFERLANIREKLPTWWGEIYQEGHRGCYTSQARSKKFNWQSESMYRSLEFLSGFAVGMGLDNHYPALNINTELILINQFHDILPGSAVNEVYQDSYHDYDKVLSEGRLLLGERFSELNRLIDTSGMGIPIVVWNLNQNPLPTVVRLAWNGQTQGRLIDSDGIAIPFLIENGQLVFVMKNLPSLGYSVLHWIEEPTLYEHLAIPLASDFIENSRYKVSFNSKGEIINIFDKTYQRELLTEGKIGNRLTLYFDYPKSNDAWDIDRDYQDSCETLHASILMEAHADALKQWITVQYQLPNSRIEQDIILWDSANAIDFNTRVDWHERHRLLKAEFDFDICASKAVFDIPFGVIERDTRPNSSYQQAQFEVPALSFADLSEGNYGVSLISEYKNGFSVKDQKVSLSLLRAPTYPDTEADQGEHEFHYSVIGHVKDFREGSVIHASRNLINPAYAVQETSHSGSLPSKFSFISISKENVIIEALKAAEDGNGLVLRVYESHGQSDHCTIHFQFSISGVEECNLVEEKIAAGAEFSSHTLNFKIKPFEIKTFRLLPQ